MADKKSYAATIAGIACLFTGHSTRNASTSAAARAGDPGYYPGSSRLPLGRDIQAHLPEIIRQGTWSLQRQYSMLPHRTHFIFYFDNTGTFSVDDTPFLRGPLVLVISFVVRLVSVHIQTVFSPIGRATTFPRKFSFFIA